jgi:hypothetical protein
MYVLLQVRAVDNQNLAVTLTCWSVYSFITKNMNNVVLLELS